MSQPPAPDACALSGEQILERFDAAEIADLLALVGGVRPDRTEQSDAELGEWLASTITRPGALDVALSLPLEGRLAELLERAVAVLDDAQEHTTRLPLDKEEDTAPRLVDKEEDTTPRLRDREDVTQPELEPLSERTDPHAGLLVEPVAAPVEREVTDVGVVVHDLAPSGVPELEAPVDPPPIVAPPASVPSVPASTAPPTGSRKRMRLYLILLVGELLVCAFACAGLLFGVERQAAGPEKVPQVDRAPEVDLAATLRAGAPSALGPVAGSPVTKRNLALGDLAPKPAVEANLGALRSMPKGQPTGEVHAALPDVLDMRFIELTGGEFTMGAGLQSGDPPFQELPSHRVAVGTFWLAVSEVSVAQWHGLHGRLVPAGEDPSHAMGGVGWCDAVRYANLLSDQEDLLPFYVETDQCESEGTVGVTGLNGGYRLPTEAEWEYAARAGRLELPSAALPCPKARNSSAATGNGWGFMGMVGVVWEWTWNSKYRYLDKPHIDVVGSSSRPEKVIRGGSWASADLECSVTSRRSADFPARNDDLGFRLAR